MADSPNELIKRYLQDTIAAESSFETQLAAFSREGDDAEVQALFAAHARETQIQSRRLTQRLEELGGSTSTTKSWLAHIFGLGPMAAQLAHTPEERLVQNLMMAYAVEKSECAMYEALAVACGAAGDAVTEQIARDIQEEQYQTADKIWSFLPSRSKIAFNLLTATEMDPAVETRMADDRVL